MPSLLSPDKEELHEKSVAGLTGNLIGLVGRLARQEVDLAKSELKQSARQSAKDSAGVLFGAAALYTGMLTMTALVCLALSFAMPMWASLLTVSVVLLTIGAISVRVCLGKLAEDAKLQHLPKSLATNRDFLREQIA